MCVQIHGVFTMVGMAAEKKPNRSGVALNMFLPPDLSEAMQGFMDSLPVVPTKTAVVSKAMRDYFVRMGRLPGEVPTSVLWYVGPIAAGTPLEVFDNPPERIDLGEELGGEGRYVFVVRGDSMEQERIFDGDRVVIQRDPEPKGGDIVVARIDRALTLKKLMATRGDEIRVVSCDGKSKSFVLQPDRGDAILGKFVAVYRKAK